MTVKFEFTLSDVDAENMIDMFNMHKNKMLFKAVSFLAKNDNQMADWYNRQADYVEELKQKILAGNTRVD